MAAERQFAFGAFRFDSGNGRLWQGRDELKLTPRAAAVLHVLIERSEDVVTKEELFQRVWRGIAVSDYALTSCIKELRATLGDSGRRPRIIETRHRRGYRLMVPVRTVAAHGPSASGQVMAAKSSELTGRDVELQELVRCFDEACSGRREVVLLTGEPGIGKSALADGFLAQLPASRVVIVAEGQCVDQHGIGEPYLPLIEALTRLAKGPHGDLVRSVLSVQAPSWLSQMPWLGNRGERGRSEARGQTTRERMMRELTFALEEIASDTPLILRLEDLHWSDLSTLDWIGHFARRTDPTRLMLLATFRPGDAAAAKVGLGHLVTELALHARCREMTLTPLRLQDVEGYLDVRLGPRQERAWPKELARQVLDRTGGNPLFLTGIVGELLERTSSDQPLIAINSIPRDVRRFIEGQIGNLDEIDRELLGAASVVGREFASPAVAAILNVEVEQVEIGCARLARESAFLAKSGSTSWPDGAPGELYLFRHDLYRELLYEHLPSARRAASHRRLGTRLEQAWARHLDAIAAELGEHFERGGELAKAIPYHQRAAKMALRISANQEAIGHFQRALNALGHVADELERTRIEIDLRVGIGAAFMMTRGFGAPEVLEAYARAEELCDRLGDQPNVFPAIWGQWAFRHGRGEFSYARRLCGKLLALAEKSDSTILKLHAHHAIWPTLFSCGEPRQALEHVEAGLALYDTASHRATAATYGKHDASTCARSFGAVSLALMAEDQPARTMVEDALATATELKDPFTLALTYFFASVTGQLLGDLRLATVNAEAGLQISTEHGFSLTKAWSAGVAAWCAAEAGDPQRGFALFAEAIGALRQMQSMAYVSYLLGLLANAKMNAGAQLEAMQAVTDAIATAEVTGERFYLAELYRLQGELLAHPSVSQLEKSDSALRMAVEIARHQNAHLLERKTEGSVRQFARLARGRVRTRR